MKNGCILLICQEKALVQTVRRRKVSWNGGLMRFTKKKNQPLPLCMYISRVLPTPVVVFVKSLNCFARQSDTFAWTFRLWGAVQAAHSLAFVGVYSLLKLRRQMVLVLPPTPPLPLSPPPLFFE